MDASFGIVGKDYVIIACDQNAGRSIIVLKSDQDKTKNLSERLVMSVSAQGGDLAAFSEYIERNIDLYSVTNDYALSPKAAAHFIRSEIAGALRTRKPYQVNLLLGGYDDQNGPELYWLDYFGTLQKLKYAAHGYAQHLTLGLMDRHYKKDMSLEEGLALLKNCIAEMSTRFVANFPRYTIKIITKEGIKVHQ